MNGISSSQIEFWGIIYIVKINTNFCRFELYRVEYVVNNCIKSCYTYLEEFFSCPELGQVAKFSIFRQVTIPRSVLSGSIPYRRPITYKCDMLNQLISRISIFGNIVNNLPKISQPWFVTDYRRCFKLNTNIYFQYLFMYY